MKDKIQKSNKMKRQEIKAKKERALVLKKKAHKPQPRVYVLNKKVRNLTSAIEDVFKGVKFPYSEHKIKNIEEAVGKAGYGNRDFLKRTFLHFADLNIDFAEKRTANYQNRGTDPIDVLVNLAKYQPYVIRKIEDWKPNSYNINKQVFSFARHLYAKYYVPQFMDKAWYEQINPANPVSKQAMWFIHVGQGKNFSKVDGLPLPLTKREAHHVMAAPSDFTIPQAIRYGQVLNMGGNEVFVRQILRTRIAVDFNNNEFWTSVFRWLMLHPMLDVAHYAPLVDYIYNQKFVPCRLDVNGYMECAQPNMCMKNRDPQTTLAQMEKWHKQLGKEKAGKFNNWASSGIKGFYHKNESDKTVYAISEICTQKELIAEGNTMRHCVGSYAGSCVEGRVSIWKFEEMTYAGIEKRLTIEVDNRSRTITQARGKFNAVASASDRHWLVKWASDAQLSIGRYMI
jgi:hypothetical protein